MTEITFEIDPKIEIPGSYEAAANVDPSSFITKLPVLKLGG
jgi:hypothetical protein